VNTYNLNLSSVSPQPRIPGLEQSPPITNTKIWFEPLINSRGLSNGTITRHTEALGNEYVDIFKTMTPSKYDWAHCIYRINHNLLKDNETLGFEIWSKTNLDKIKFRAGIAEGNDFGHNSLSNEYTATTPISTNGSWKLFRADKVLSLNESHKKPNIFFGNGYNSVGTAIWAKPKITYSNKGGVVDVFKIPDDYGATKLNLNFLIFTMMIKNL